MINFIVINSDYFYFRRKCEVVRDVDAMEPKDLTSSRSLYTSAQIKIRYIIFGRVMTKRGCVTYLLCSTVVCTNMNIVTKFILTILVNQIPIDTCTSNIISTQLL